MNVKVLGRGFTDESAAHAAQMLGDAINDVIDDHIRDRNDVKSAWRGSVINMSFGFKKNKSKDEKGKKLFERNRRYLEDAFRRAAKEGIRKCQSGEIPAFTR